jgi:hypothetical protein
MTVVTVYPHPMPVVEVVSSLLLNTFSPNFLLLNDGVSFLLLNDNVTLTQLAL